MWTTRQNSDLQPFSWDTQPQTSLLESYSYPWSPGRGVHQPLLTHVPFLRWDLPFWLHDYDAGCLHFIYVLPHSAPLNLYLYILFNILEFLWLVLSLFFLDSDLLFMSELWPVGFPLPQKWTNLFFPFISYILRNNQCSQFPSQPVPVLDIPPILDGYHFQILIMLFLRGTK